MGIALGDIYCAMLLNNEGNYLYGTGRTSRWSLRCRDPANLRYRMLVTLESTVVGVLTCCVESTL